MLQASRQSGVCLFPWVIHQVASSPRIFCMKLVPDGKVSSGKSQRPTGERWDCDFGGGPGFRLQLRLNWYWSLCRASLSSAVTQITLPASRVAQGLLERVAGSLARASSKQVSKKGKEKLLPNRWAFRASHLLISAPFPLCVCVCVCVVCLSRRWRLLISPSSSSQDFH